MAAELEFDLVIRGERIMTTAGIAAREVGVLDGTIRALEPLGNGLRGRRTIELAARKR
jgi:allantoinase